MAYKLKKDKTYKSPTGEPAPDLYVVIDCIIIDKYRKAVDIQLRFYIDKQRRIDGYKPADIQRLICDNPIQWDTYFELGKKENEFIAAYEWALTAIDPQTKQLKFPDLESDE